MIERLRCGAAEIGLSARHERGLRKNDRAENSHQPARRRERKMQRFASTRAPLPLAGAMRTGSKLFCVATRSHHDSLPFYSIGHNAFLNDELSVSPAVVRSAVRHAHSVILHKITFGTLL